MEPKFTSTVVYGKKGYKIMAAALQRENGDHVVLAAPDIESLARLWKEVTDLTLDETKVQKIIAVKDYEG